MHMHIMMSLHDVEHVQSLQHLADSGKLELLIMSYAKQA